MKVWVVLWEDRHSDPDVRLFVTQGDALQFARQTAQEYKGFSARYIEERIDGILGTPSYRFSIDYSPEGDSLTVMERGVRPATDEDGSLSPEQAAEARANMQSVYPTWAKKADWFLPSTQEPLP